MSEPAVILSEAEQHRKPPDSAVTATPEPLREVFARCLRAGCEWFAHTVLAVFIIGCNSGVEAAIVFFSHSPDPKFFGLLPVAWIFHGADAGVLVGLSVYGVHAAVITYRGKRKLLE